MKLQKYYNLRLDKNKAVNHTISMDATIGGESDDNARTIADMLESEESWDDHSADDVIMLVQSYINKNKIIEAILIDNIAFNDVQRYFKKTIKTESGKYTEISSEFWPYQLVKIVSRLSDEYKWEFLSKYKISEEKLDAVLAAVGHGGLKEGQIINKMVEMYEKDHPKVVSDEQILDEIQEMVNEMLEQNKDYLPWYQG